MVGLAARSLTRVVFAPDEDLCHLRRRRTADLPRVTDQPEAEPPLGMTVKPEVRNQRGPSLAGSFDRHGRGWLPHRVVIGPAFWRLLGSKSSALLVGSAFESPATGYVRPSAVPGGLHDGRQEQVYAKLARCKAL